MALELVANVWPVVEEGTGFILTPAFAELEKEFARMQGIGESSATGELVDVGVIPRFPAEPYLVVTSLLETPQGQLVPQIRI